jgi:hypothetical protein
MATQAVKEPKSDIDAGLAKSLRTRQVLDEPYITSESQLQTGITEAEGRAAKAKQQQEEMIATAEQESTKKQAEDIRGAQQAYQGKLETEPLPAFVPTKDNVQDIAGLFSLISVIGAVAGKNNAQMALGNMNAMLEGYQKGRGDLYKKEATEFDKNFKAMIKKHEEFRREMEDAIKLAPIDKDAAMAEAKMAAVKAGSAIVQAQLDKGYLLNAYNTVKDLHKGIDKGIESYEKLKAKEAEIAFRAGVKAGLGTAPAGANVTSDVESSAQAIANYAQKPPGLRDKTRPQIMARVRQINPNYNEMDYGQRDLALRNYTNPNGTGAKQLQAFTTVAGHLQSLETLGEALNNKDTQLANQALNYIAVQTGNPEVTNFNAAKQAVAGEVVKAITGTAGALADRKEAEQIFSEIKSPAQLQGAIDTVKELIYSRLDTTRAHYESATGRHDFETRLPDIVRQTFVDKKRPSAASAPQPSSRVQAPTEAVQYLKQHPEFKEQFKSKYGYLPEGM